ncbi:bifunctional diguanylate cyclase/phosphodiesterase [Actinoplanes sp. TBRC 11911]|uniref:putative bifunctional diguanylate cyclase/phosphodiesterase n=1 Tax=Actinoplanes sp. TBRC 11911 TaxID=2729386 RepID=UPI00289857D7|nr:bifunctional diguanylate cyclase/phosphodiesterase [Actinoplanes sp. TBRC 11911]
MGKVQVWRWWLAAGVLAITAYYLMPEGSTAGTLIYSGIGLASGLAILVAVRRYRLPRPGMWYWIAAGMFANTIGDILYDHYKYVLDKEAYPSFADVFYLASYPCTLIGLLLLVRGRRGKMAELVDAAIVATGLSLVFWVFVLHPMAAATAATLTGVISTAYPAIDVLLLALLARLFTDAAKRTPSTLLIGLATALLLAADIGFSLLTLHAGTDPRPLDALFQLSYLCWAAAALHPSPAAPAEDEEANGVGRGRLALFGACSLLAPVLLFVPQVGMDGLDRSVVAVGSAVLFLLVIARMAGFASLLRRQSATMRRAALQDDLTGLANRRRFDLDLLDALAHGPVHVVFLGLNGFKNVNDELGRPVGDRVLRLMAGRLQRVAPADSLVARLGGDEFAVLFPEAQAGRRPAELVAALREPVLAGGHELLVGVAAGVAESAGDQTDPVEMVRRAEAAMHAAKQTGEPVRRWTAALDERAGERARMGAELQAGLADDQFRVVYQPIVDVPSGRVAAVEALVRWQHPERGLVPPMVFIPVAEQNGLIVELGEWILRTACARLARWRAGLGDEAPGKVSVNVSARQLSRPGFADTVAAALADSGVPAHCLAVEVTETAVFEGGQAVTALHELRALGVRIALDDFGTGHSSLGLLQTVPVDILKVDKSFVDRITEAGRHAVIAEALIQVSAGLGLDAVAEGVETAAQAEALSRRGYRLLQGYHFGRPVADPDFALVRAAAS